MSEMRGEHERRMRGAQWSMVRRATCPQVHVQCTRPGTDAPDSYPMYVHTIPYRFSCAFRLPRLVALRGFCCWLSVVTEEMENPHAERQAVLLERIVKNSVRDKDMRLASKPTALIICRRNVSRSSRNLTTVSRFACCTYSVVLGNQLMSCYRKSIGRTETFVQQRASLPNTERTCNIISKPPVLSTIHE